MTSVVGEASVWGPETKLTGSVLLLDQPGMKGLSSLESGQKRTSTSPAKAESASPGQLSTSNLCPLAKAAKDRYDPFNVLRFNLNVAPTNGDIPGNSIPGTGSGPPCPNMIVDRIQLSS